MPETELTVVRRAEATRFFVRYFLLAFATVCMFSSLVAWAILQGQAQRRESRAIRIEYCSELEKLKTQNREDVAEARRDYARNLRLLGIKDTPELRKAAEESWAKKLRRNAPKPCPYTAR